jgi:hypothetical protein
MFIFVSTDTPSDIKAQEDLIERQLPSAHFASIFLV